MITFSANELRDAYKVAGVEKGRIVYITGNLGRLGTLVDGTKRLSKHNVLKTHYDVLQSLLGPDGTLVFPTHSWDMVNSNEPFSLQGTPSGYLFSEYLRNHTKAIRQFHPFSSVASCGADQNQIINDNITYHPYGPNTPWERMIEREAIHVSIGLPARMTISAVHHCEYLAGVPYRFSKTFRKKVLAKSTQVDREFSLFVMYEGLDVVRDRNIKIFDIGPIKENLKQSIIGRSGVQAVRLDIFARETVSAMQSQPYIWLSGIPQVRPWEK